METDQLELLQGRQGKKQQESLAKTTVLGVEGRCQRHCLCPGDVLQHQRPYNSG